MSRTADFSLTVEHAIAMEMQAIMNGVQALDRIAATPHGFELVLSDLDDLELTYQRFGQLLRSLRGAQEEQEAAE